MSDGIIDTQPSACTICGRRTDWTGIWQGQLTNLCQGCWEGIFGDEEGDTDTQED